MAFWGRSRRAGRPSASPKAAFGFGEAAYARLAERIERARQIAVDRETTVIASVTVPLDPALDPIAHLRAAAAESDFWTALAQPARDDFVLAALGEAFRIVSGDGDRFDSVARATGEALEAALVDDLFDDPSAPAGAGVVWVGGFAFYDEASYGDAWRDFASTSFTLPRASIARRGGADPQSRLTLNVRAAPETAVTELIGEVESLVEAMMLDAPLPAEGFVPREGPATVASFAAPEHFERAVEQAAAEIRDGKYEKIVLAREVGLRREQPIDPFNAFRGLAERFPECTIFAVSERGTTFIGASPELLIRREGRRASTMALAGSMRRGADPETDAHLGAQLLSSAKNLEEHAIVVRRIERALGRYSAWISAGEEPELVKVKNIQHLATPIRAQLTEPRPVIELAGALHPTPAVGGEPWSVASERIRALEGFDRGWYTGGVGWMDLFEDGEFHVALRSALIDGPQARLYAGCGIVGDSDPGAELAETETKLEALLPVLSAS